LTQRKELRLFFIVVAILVLVVGVRLLAQSLHGRRIEWVGVPTSGVAQAAPSNGNEPIQVQVQSKPAQYDTVTKDSTLIPRSTTSENLDQEPTYVNPSDSDSSTPLISTSTTPARQPSVIQAQSCSLPNGAPGLDINTADAEQLDGLPGIGPSIAAAILQERGRRGRYNTLNELLDVKGIGTARLAHLSDFVCVNVSDALP
jgi:competence ComEA-like helix-hairpin-helix protein